MTDRDIRRQGLRDRWSRLEEVKRRTPSQAEFANAIVEQTTIEDELRSLDGRDGERAGR